MIITAKLLKRYEKSSTVSRPSVISKLQNGEADDRIRVHSHTVIGISPQFTAYLHADMSGAEMLVWGIPRSHWLLWSPWLITANLTVLLTWGISTCGIPSQPRRRGKYSVMSSTCRPQRSHWPNNSDVKGVIRNGQRSKSGKCCEHIP
jgi:hypothetical protein